jgi:hypothetical protein
VIFTNFILAEVNRRKAKERRGRGGKIGKWFARP